MDERALAEAYDEMWRCMVERDLAGLADVCAGEFALHHMTGMRQGREEFLNAVADGTLRYFEAEHDVVEAQVDEDGRTATVTGRTRVLAAVFGGGRHRWRLACRLRARKAAGSWRFTEEFVGTY